MGRTRHLFCLAALVCCGLFGGGAGLRQEAEAQTTERVSVKSNGNQAKDNSYFPSISADGRFVAFFSDASNLVAGDTNASGDVFVRDRETGETELASVRSNGKLANGRSYSAAISANGRFVAFVSSATNLVAGDTNGAPDIFLRDRKTGETRRVSVRSNGTQANGPSSSPVISANGRFVAFVSSATSLVAGDTNRALDIFVHDRNTGETQRVSVGSGGAQANDDSYTPAISANGRFVAFGSDATSLVPDINRSADVFVHDRKTGQTELVSVNNAGEPGDDGGYAPSISANGRFVAFQSTSFDAETNIIHQIFVRDRRNGTTQRVSVNGSGEPANDDNYYPAISANGQFVAFESRATNLVGGDTNSNWDVFVRDRKKGRTQRVSVKGNGKQANGRSGEAEISSDGRFVAFQSNAPDLVNGDTNGTSDIFIRDRGE